MEIEIGKIKIYEDYKKEKDCLTRCIDGRQWYYEHITHLIGWLRHLRKCENKRFVSKNRPNIMFANDTDIVEGNIVRNILFFRNHIKYIEQSKDRLGKFNVL
jgi:hypothetical protein